MCEGGQSTEISEQKTARKAKQPGHLQRLAPTDFNFNIPCKQRERSGIRQQNFNLTTSHTTQGQFTIQK